MSETAALITYDEADVMCVDTHPNVNRQRSAFVARGIAGVTPHKLFHVLVSYFAKKETQLLKGMIVPQASRSVAWLTTADNKSIQEETVKTGPLYKPRTDKALQVQCDTTVCSPGYEKRMRVHSRDNCSRISGCVVPLGYVKLGFFFYNQRNG